jgi:hypothetical protein
VNNAAMVSMPGSGLLSTGFQQVKNRPFFMSEWMSLIPTEWTAESSPLVAAYGLGLQGWDASYAFAWIIPILHQPFKAVMAYITLHRQLNLLCILLWLL